MFPLPVTVANEGLAWDSLLTCNVILVVTVLWVTLKVQVDHQRTTGLAEKTI